MIEVRHESGRTLYRHDPRRREPDAASRHRTDAADVARLGGGKPAEAVIAAAFRFLLDREPRNRSWPGFDLMVIARYFPEFERELPGYLAAG